MYNIVPSTPVWGKVVNNVILLTAPESWNLSSVLSISKQFQFSREFNYHNRNHFHFYKPFLQVKKLSGDIYWDN